MFYLIFFTLFLSRSATLYSHSYLFSFTLSLLGSALGDTIDFTLKTKHEKNTMKENVFLTFDSWERIEMLWCVVCASLSSKYEFVLIWRVSLAIIYRSCLPSHIMINFNQKSFKQNVFNVKKKCAHFSITNRTICMMNGI